MGMILDDFFGYTRYNMTYIHDLFHDFGFLKEWRNEENNYEM